FGIRPKTVVHRLKPPPPEIIAAQQMMLAQEDEKPTRTAEAIVPGQALDDLLNKVRSGRVRMTAIRFAEGSDAQIPVPLAELNGLVFRFATGHRVGVGLRSRLHGSLVWSSPQFLRTDVMRAWPARNKKKAATTHAILRYLRQIRTPETPPTKLDAHRRSMPEVPHAYPDAFKKAEPQLAPPGKGGRGQPRQARRRHRQMGLDQPRADRRRRRGHFRSRSPWRCSKSRGDGDPGDRGARLE